MVLQSENLFDFNLKGRESIYCAIDFSCSNCNCIARQLVDIISRKFQLPNQKFSPTLLLKMTEMLALIIMIFLKNFPIVLKLLFWSLYVHNSLSVIWYSESGYERDLDIEQLKLDSIETQISIYHRMQWVLQETYVMIIMVV